MLRKIIFSYRLMTVILILSLGFAIVETFEICLMSEKELYNCAHHIGQSSPTGGRNRLLKLFMYQSFGKIGVIVETWILEPIIFVFWFLTYQEHKEEKQKKRDRLQREKEQMEQLSKRKSWRKKQEQKRKKNKNS